MSFQWLDMRISEEKERRRREAEIQQRLPDALEEVRSNLQDCIEAYAQAFGLQAAEIQASDARIAITVREEVDGEWRPRGSVDVALNRLLPGFDIGRPGDPLSIEVGLLPGEKLFYKDGEQYITIDELTRRILDRALFPKLVE